MDNIKIELDLKNLNEILDFLEIERNSNNFVENTRKFDIKTESTNITGCFISHIPELMKYINEREQKSKIIIYLKYEHAYRFDNQDHISKMIRDKSLRSLLN